MIKASVTSLKWIELEKKYNAQNYSPLPVVIAKGRGAKVWDVDGIEYLDFLSAYSALNQGHNHPKIVAALMEQAQNLTLTSRAFYNDQLGPFAEWICHQLGYERILPMNSGAEGVETAIKLARRWGYRIKGVAENLAQIVVLEGNFHGRTMAAISCSNDPSSRRDFGPYLPGVIRVPFDDRDALDALLAMPNVVGFLMEPIQGEAGIYVPSEGYLRFARESCSRNQVLFIADEVQTGLGRTGRLMACDHENVKPDVLILGKALSGGMFPISAVFSSSEVMLTIGPGEHGSTFGGNPLACVVARASLEVILEEKLADRADRLGKIFRDELVAFSREVSIIKEVRGRGLLNAVEIIPHGKNEKGEPKTAYDLCYQLLARGLLAKQTHVHTIRFAPPLVIDEADLRRGIEIIKDVIRESQS